LHPIWKSDSVTKLSKDILLVVPISRSHYVVPPLGLGYLATSLRRAGFDSVAILDCVKERLSLAGLAAAVKLINPRVVGFQLVSSDFASVKRAIDLVKEVLPRSVVILGGPHVSATGTSVMDEMPKADYAFVGEGEIGLPLLLRRLLGEEKIAREEIPGLVWRGEHSLNGNKRAFVADLDSIGFPAWDLMPPDTYPDAPQGAFYKQFPIAPMASSRGCPYRCAFCGSPVNMSNRLRFRSLPHVFSEMQFLRDHYGVKEFHFVDDMFNASRSRVRAFCNTLESKKWDISYTFPNGLRLNTLDADMLSRMKKTGAYAFTVGIESGSQRILDAMNKKLTVEMIREKVNLVKAAGLEPSGFFLLGFPGETKEDMEMTLRLAKSLPLKRAHFSNFLPLPGTEATRKLIESGEIVLPDWNELAYSKVPYAPRGMTKNELKAFQRRAFLEFHLRPRILFKMLSEIRSPFHLWSIIKRAKDYLFSS
jgi:anaerobic magnesium-protoporphyrin IX monomethyl ester cyclase